MDSPDELLQRLTVPTRLGEKPTLDRMRSLLAALGDPQRGLPVLHVGGTSGKGSTATIAARILQVAGFRVGLHVKPHLERVEERVIVDGAMISTNRMMEHLRDCALAAEEVRPTWYELTVATAFKHFREERVDVAVVEVGLGGTYDGTNVVDPLATILTNVGLDHTEILGSTVEEIAADKVGIIKGGAVAISGVTQPSVKEIVRRRCEDVGAPCWQLSRDVTYAITRLSSDGSSFNLTVPSAHFDNLRLNVLGAHQVANAALAVAGVASLGPRGFPVPDGAVRRALESVEVPGRLEVVRRVPLVILDGAHNPAKMTATAESLADLFPNRPITAVLGFKRGHDLSATLNPLLPSLRRAVLTRFDADTDFGRGQSIEPDRIDRLLGELGARFERTCEVDPRRAVEMALGMVESDGLVCVTGSLYLVGAVRRLFREFQ